MKKIIITLLCLLLSFGCVSIAQAEDDLIIVETTEKVPGVDCTPKKRGENDPRNVDAWGGNIIYECKVEKGFSAVMSMIGSIIKYFTYITMLCAVLFIVVGGIMYSMSWLDSGMKEEAKKRIIQAVFGLILLMLSWVILYILFPWIYT